MNFTDIFIYHNPIENNPVYRKSCYFNFFSKTEMASILFLAFIKFSSSFLFPVGKEIEKNEEIVVRTSHVTQNQKLKFFFYNSCHDNL